MSTTTHPFGKPDEAKEADNTADQKRDAATAPELKDTGVPSGVNREVWAQAEAAVVNQNGGMAGVSPAGRRKQIQDRYDQMLENNKQTERWAGDSNLLGGR